MLSGFQDQKKKLAFKTIQARLILHTTKKSAQLLRRIFCQKKKCFSSTLQKNKPENFCLLNRIEKPTSGAKSYQNVAPLALKLNFTGTR